METKHIGVINTWLHARGFGFVHSTENGVETKYFLHVSRIIKGTPAFGACVQFDVLPLREGRYASAVDAVIVEGGAQ